jgi:hypothetical protein
MSLYDDIQKRLRAVAAQPPASAAAPSGQAIAQGVFQAKTGRAAAPGAAPRASNVGEQVTNAAAAAQTAQVGAAATQQAEQLEAAKTAADVQAEGAQSQLATRQRIASADLTANAASAAGARETAGQQFTLAQQTAARLQSAKISAAFDQTIKDAESKSKVARDDVFEQFRQGAGELNQRKDAAALEQTAFMLALADRKYVDKLQEIGQERRLSNDLNWKSESQRLILGDKMADLQHDVTFNTAFNANQRQWNEYLAGLDDSAAMAIAMSQIQSQNNSTMIQGAGTLAQAGAKGYANRDTTTTDSSASGSANNPRAN